MNVLASRLDTALKALGLSPHKFNKKHEGKGVSRATLFNALDPVNFTRFETVVTICELEPSISAEYLVRGVGEPLLPSYAIGDADPCGKYIDHIQKQSQQNAAILRPAQPPQPD